MQFNFESLLHRQKFSQLYNMFLLWSCFYEDSSFTHHSKNLFGLRKSHHSLWQTVIMNRKRRNEVCLFSCSQHAMQYASSRSKATEEISLAPTTKLFARHAKKMSVRKASGGQWFSPGSLRKSTAREELWKPSGKLWRMDGNKNHTRGKSRSSGKSDWASLCPLTPWAKFYLALKQQSANVALILFETWPMLKCIKIPKIQII